MNFPETLETHLNAVTGRNLDQFLATVADDDDVTLILPNGHLVKGRSEIAEFHQTWFADDDWTMKIETLRTVETAEMGLALLKIDYRDIDEGEVFEKRYFLSLVFAKQGDAWKLVHDQNTFTENVG